MEQIKNIFVSGYSAGYVYNKHDIVFATSGNTAQYFVSCSDNQVGTLDSGLFQSNNYWKRFGDLSWKFSDVWTPTIQSQVDFTPSSKNFRFGDGYEQRSENDIFGTRQSYNVSFDAISMTEARSLLAFFEYNGAEKPFITDIPPFVYDRKFVAKGWRFLWEDQNINNLGANFTEHVNV